MSYINLRCKTCGGLMSLDLSSKNILCSHCGKAYKLSGLLNDHDFRLISKMSDKELNYKITANSFVKEGDSLLYQASYEKAEQSYKKAIEIDELNYRAYLGVVRAKTHNLNILPNVDDYRYYARKAVEFADDDDKIYVKNELSKLALLRQEKQKREKELTIEIKRHLKNNAQKKYHKLFGKLASAIIVAITAIVVLLIIIGK